MTERRVACPRCSQDWLVRVRLVNLERDAILCPECDALWQIGQDLAASTFEDYGSFMVRHGRPQPEARGEIEIRGPLLKDPPGDSA
jgi:hypothetical protein